MRMLAAYKPTDTLLPVAIVSVHCKKKDDFCVDVLLVNAESIDAALFAVLSRGPSVGRLTDGWKTVETYTNLKDALERGVYVVETLQTLELQETKGMELYLNLYNKAMT